LIDRCSYGRIIEYRSPDGKTLIPREITAVAKGDHMTKRNKKDKVRLKSGVISGALALSMGLSLLSSSGGIEAAQAAKGDVIPHSEYIDHRSGKIEYKLPGITSRHLWQLSQKSVIVNGRTLSEPAVTMNGVTYLPLRAFASSLGQAGSDKVLPLTITLF